MRDQAGAGRPVGDVGCGPGHACRYLAGRGLSVVGVDVSPGMVTVARLRHPHLRFEVGTFAQLPAGDGEWAGAVAPYSIIHLDRDGRRTGFAELARVIAAGGWLLVSFHISDADASAGQVRRLTDWWDTPVELDFHFLDPDEVSADLASAGLRVMSRTDREPWPDVEHASRRVTCSPNGIRLSQGAPGGPYAASHAYAPRGQDWPSTPPFATRGARAALRVCRLARFARWRVPWSRSCWRFPVVRRGPRPARGRRPSARRWGPGAPRSAR